MAFQIEELQIMESVWFKSFTASQKKRSLLLKGHKLRAENKWSETGIECTWEDSLHNVGNFVISKRNCYVLNLLFRARTLIHRNGSGSNVSLNEAKNSIYLHIVAVVERNKNRVGYKSAVLKTARNFNHSQWRCTWELRFFNNWSRSSNSRDWHLK